MKAVSLARAFVCVFGVLFAASAAAQGRATVGPARCVDCHDHRAEKEWWQTKDGDGKGKAHAKADRRLEDPKAAQYSKAIGLSDVYRPDGACVSCHATVVSGSADFGVSCESCHGPGRDYLTPHQTKGTYAAAVRLGMMDVKEKPEAWARTCIGCHVLDARPGMQALIKAGHSSGSDFDLARKFPVVAQHFKKTYQPAQIASAAAAFKPAASTPVAQTPTAAPVPAPTPAPAPVPSPAPNVTSEPGKAAVDPRGGTAPAVIPAPRAAPLSLPTIVKVPAPAPAPMNREATPSVAPQAAPAVEPARSAGGSIQDRLVSWLAQLIAGNTQVAIAPPAALRQIYRGPDAELLRLQDEVIRLAIEALAVPPRRQ